MVTLYAYSAAIQCPACAGALTGVLFRNTLVKKAQVNLKGVLNNIYREGISYMKLCIALVSLVSLLLSTLPRPARAAEPPVTLSYDTACVFQSWEGFGASAAWWAQDIGGWPDNRRARLLSLLFDRDTGIGLTMLRYNIGAGGGENIADPWRRTECFEVSPGVYDWSRDANAVRVMREAAALGVKDFIAFANSPPPRMTVSGKVTGRDTGESNLRKDMRHDFAVYLTDITGHLAEAEGIPFRYISPINEPQWDWKESKGQEGCHYTPEECVLMARALADELAARGLAIRVSAVDCGQWGKAALYLDLMMADDTLAKCLPHYALHSYWSDAAARGETSAALAARYPVMPIWMSEWTEMRSGRDTGMASALTLAQTVMQDLTIGGVISWQYWIAVSKYDYCDGLIYTDAGAQNIIPTKRLWALGNFSRFILPGSTRVACSLETLREGVSVCAFANPNGEVAVVIVNLSADAFTVAPGNPAVMVSAIYKTTADADLAQAEITRSREAAIDPYSVTTLILK
jgi:O-glycosyl hydrolase